MAGAEGEILVVGVGSGRRRQLTPEAARIIYGSRIVVGGRRLLGLAPRGAETFAVGADLEAVKDFISQRIGRDDVCVITSGDPGCFSILPFLGRHFPGRLRVVPGISSPQMLAARLGIPWQDWRLVSVHGREAAAKPVPPREPTVYFCDDANPPAAVASRLLAGMGDCPAAAAADLGSACGQLQAGTLEEIAAGSLPGNSLLLVMPPAGGETAAGAYAPGIADQLWLRGEGIPMSKSEARSVLLGKAQPQGRGVIWDVGAGTGCYAVECSLLAPSARVIAVDRKPEACRLVAENARRFGARVETVGGEAPGCLKALPPPDLAIIGGNDGRLDEIFTAVTGALNPGGRVMVTAVLERTRKAAHDLFADSGLADRTVTRVAVARGDRARWNEHNPVLIFSGDRSGAEGDGRRRKKRKERHDGRQG